MNLKNNDQYKFSVIGYRETSNPKPIVKLGPNGFLAKLDPKGIQP